MLLNPHTGYWVRMTVKTAPRVAVAQPSYPRLQEVTPAERFEFDRVACRDCGGWFPAPEGSALLYSGSKGPAPTAAGISSSFSAKPAEIISRCRLPRS
jgi:hypothetical protein